MDNLFTEVLNWGSEQIYFFNHRTISQITAEYKYENTTLMPY